MSVAPVKRRSDTMPPVMRPARAPLLALLALLTSVAIQSLRRPTSTDLRADDRRTMTLDQALDRLDRLERVEQKTTPKVAPDDARPATEADRSR